MHSYNIRLVSSTTVHKNRRTMAVDQHEVIELLDSDEDDVQVENTNRNGDEDVEEVQVERAVRNAAPARADDDEDLVVTGAFSCS